MIEFKAPNHKYGFSQTATVAAGSRLLFVSGQSGADENGEYAKDFRTQLRQCLRNLTARIEGAGGSQRTVAKITVLITDLDEERHDILDSELKATFPEDCYPTSTLIPVPRLSTLGMQVEIDAVGGVIASPLPSIPPLYPRR